MAEISKLVEAMGAEDPVRAYQAERQVIEAVNKATDPSRDVEREALAAALVAEVVANIPRRVKQSTNVPGTDLSPNEPKHSTRVRQRLCQLLCQIASENNVAALVPALEELELRDAVRWVLESIPTLPATSALAVAAKAVGPDFRIGVLNALGRQRWREALAILARDAKDPDAGVRLAAIEGLANFPEESNDALIAASTKTGTPRERARAQKARVRLAETLREAGEKQAARTIYQSIATDSFSGSWTKAAKLALEEKERRQG